MFKLVKLLTLLFWGSLPLYLEAQLAQSWHDPTQPPTQPNTIETTTATADIKITAIFAGKKQQTVRIGPYLFTIGDKIAGLTITAINSNSITLKKEDGSKVIVTMPSSPIKLPITNNTKENRENLD